MFVASPELRLLKFFAFVFVFHRPQCFLNYSPTHPSKNERNNCDGGGAFCRTKLAIVFLVASSVHADLGKHYGKVLNSSTVNCKTLLQGALLCCKREIETNSFDTRLTVEASRGVNMGSHCLLRQLPLKQLPIKQLDYLTDGWEAISAIAGRKGKLNFSKGRKYKYGSVRANAT